MEVCRPVEEDRQTPSTLVEGSTMASVRLLDSGRRKVVVVQRQEKDKDHIQGALVVAFVR